MQYARAVARLLLLCYTVMTANAVRSLVAESHGRCGGSRGRSAWGFTFFALVTGALCTSEWDAKFTSMFIFANHIGTSIGSFPCQAGKLTDGLVQS
ncbi:uncharacterized protein YhjY with autotransporter beta-barrel domain [Rhizobium laguerreae]